ncbi:MAG TPA: AtpZ/AtpI family protein [Gemmatimonadales bacterium]|jgi:F0F1-type ATP synthase assembly protein I|nr:AtpZ/AtpI family protein [Gemmatimonadales bacterium]
MRHDDRPPEARGFGQGYAYFGMALNFTFAILVFGAIGWLLDGWLHTRPILALAGAFLGGFAGFMSIYYRVKKDAAEDAESRRKGTR